MFKNLCICGPEETQRQINYLSSTPVRGVAELLRNGRFVLMKGIVCSLQHLGGLKTEFGQIGRLVPEQGAGEKKFLVSEIVPLLRANPTVSDGGLLRRIEAIMDSEARNEIDFNITALQWNDEIILKDGNKRTIAFYENRKNSNQVEINYGIYFVMPRQNSVRLLSEGSIQCERTSTLTT